MKRSTLRLSYYLLLCCLLPVAVVAQLRPGFEKAEYLEMLRMTAVEYDVHREGKRVVPEQYNCIYSSPVMGLDNHWSLWLHKEQPVAVISTRGTTTNMNSWLANFYVAMIPASGSLTLAPGDTFHYRLADNPRAAVHVGWTLCMAFLARDMEPRIDSCYRVGIRQFIITGHSQGGAISYLLTAYFLQRQRQGLLPADIRFKTYCSAAPKPGNLYFAYDYEKMTQDGWGYAVINTADWVPETPVSIQTVRDFNTVNPFINIKAMARKQKFPRNLALRHIYRQLDRPTAKADRKYRRYLGHMVARMVQKDLKTYKAPEYVLSNAYTRAGTFVVLQADSAYYSRYPNDPAKIFGHHFFEPYYYLAQQQLH
jgi:pimeloyl-ACP methyl ester carboxylesterase